MYRGLRHPAIQLVKGSPQSRGRAFKAVLLKGMPSIPSGRLEGMGPYEPSRRFKNRLCVRGVPTCKSPESTMSLKPARGASLSTLPGVQA